MQRYFSPSERAFYDDTIHGAPQVAKPQTAKEIKAKKRPVMIDNPDCLMPSDAVPISDKDYDAVMKELSEGKLLQADGNRAIAVDQPISAEEQLAANIRERARLLSDSDWTQLPDTLNEEMTARWAEYRQALRDLDMEGEIDWPEMPPISDTLEGAFS